MDWSEEAKQVYTQMMQAYMVERDLQKTMSFYSEDSCLIGTGPREVAHGKKQIEKVMREEMEFDGDSFSVHYNGIVISVMRDEYCTIDAELIVGKSISDIATMSMLFRQSLTLSKVGDLVEICSNHMSAPLESQEFKEFYPIKWGKKRLMEMEDEYKNGVATRLGEAVPGGVLATYMEEGYPIYFANEKLMEYLGYTKEEFLKETEGMALNCIHPYDRERYTKMVEETDFDFGDVFQIEYRMIRKDGSYIWVLNVGKRTDDLFGRRVISSAIYDIHRIHSQKENLAQKVSQFEEIISSLNCGVKICFDDGNFTWDYVSEGFGKILGYAPEECGELAGNKLETYMEKREWKKVQDKMRISFLDGPDYWVEYPIRRKDGTTIWVRDQGRKYLDVDGNIKISSVVVDISETKELLDQLQRSEEKLQIALRETNVSVWEYDLIRNPESLMKGFYLHMESQETIRQVYDQIMSGREHVVAELRMKGTEAGEYGWKRVFYTVIFDEERRPIRVVAIAVDISDEKLAQIKYQQELNLRKALTADSIHIYSVDLTKNQFNEYSNEIFYKNDYDEYVDDTVESKVHTRFQKEFRDTLKRKNLLRSFDKGQRNNEIEYLMLQDSGDYAWMRTMIRMEKDQASRHVFAYISKKNIDASVKSEVDGKKMIVNALFATEQANREKTLFISKMSHEIRTPLNAIIGLSTLALENREEPEKTQKYLTKINDTSSYLASLMNDILDVSRIEVGKIIMLSEVFHLGRLVEEVVSVVEGKFVTGQIDFTTQIDNIQHPFLLGDALRLKQILMNLLTNANKFTPSGKKVTLKIWEKRRNKHSVTIIFDVVDEGIGIEKEKIEWIFRPYEQENPTNIHQQGGAGLGLTIVKSLVGLMGGEVHVRSKVGIGSTFTVELPFEVGNESDEKEKQKRFEKKGRIDFTGQHVLLVEDNELNSEILRTILEAKNLMVETAVNGKEAVERIKQVTPGYYQLILMDVQMPIMGGFEATEKIRSFEKQINQRTPIIAISADALEEDILYAKQVGMDDYLTKPVGEDKIISMLTKYLKIR